MSPTLLRLFPFLRWLPIQGSTFKADFIAGITVALVLIPQSMAYAQLAGMPAYYGLYAAFLPVIVGALWGSSSHLSTGPVAVVSLLTASSLALLAAPGSDKFIALAIALALLVGIVQLLLGAFKLGVIVNFISHPVIVGFTNAAAIIIGLSQLAKLLGVTMERSNFFLVDILGVAQQWEETHLPSLLIGMGAMAIIGLLRRYRPLWPGVLIAVVFATVLSWSTGFEKNVAARPEQIADTELLALVQTGMSAAQQADKLNLQIVEKTAALKTLQKNTGGDSPQAVEMAAELGLLRIELRSAEARFKTVASLRRLQVVRSMDAAGNTLAIYVAGQVPASNAMPAGAELDETLYRIRKLDKNGFKLVGGGDVVGNIPEGLPSMKVPDLSLDAFASLLSVALVISLVGFMEAIAIAKAIAAKTRQRIDPNQELIGQGLANIVGSFTQSFPASGSFSRSAVNLNAGAKTGLSAIIAAAFVLLTLLFLTPLLYHLPQAALAAIIIMAVVGLINIKGIKHAWQAHRHDGSVAVITFITTLGFAPHLDKGILVGAGLALGLYLYRTMSPRVAILGRHTDGVLRDTKIRPDLPTSPYLTAIRFDGQLYFANVAYFEEAILDAVAQHPDIHYVLIVGDGINQMDASGEEVVHHLVEQLKEAGVTLVFSGLKKQVLDVMRATGLYELIGEDKIFATEDLAIAAIYQRLGKSMEGDAFCRA